MNITLDQSSVEVYVQKLISKYHHNGHKEFKYLIPCFMSFFFSCYYLTLFLTSSPSIRHSPHAKLLKCLRKVLLTKLIFDYSAWVFVLPVAIFFLKEKKKLVLLNLNVYNRPPHFQDIEAEFFNFMVSAKSKAHLLHCAVFLLIPTHTYFLPAVFLYL